MHIGFIGLGKMGANMVNRLLDHGHKINAFDINKPALKQVEEKGAVVVNSVEELVTSLPSPRVIWLMLPAGGPTEKTLNKMSELLINGDIVIDGSNSNYKDTMRRSSNIEEHGIILLDAGTSGGVWGLKEGYCLMVGGCKKGFDSVESVFRSLAPDGGYIYTGKSGSGHFIKMVHNGIEYGMLQAYAEGFEIIHAKKEFDIDMATLANVWNRGSVIRSWLLELAELAFNEDNELASIKDYVEDSGEGRWTIAEAIELDVPAPVITISLLERFRSRQNQSFSAKVIAALRNQFGGHDVQKNK